MKEHKPILPDQNQTFWQMAGIQISGFGVPSLLLGGALGTKYGPGSAIVSIAIGNLILWLIGLGIISMTVSKRKSAIQNLKDYVGKSGKLLGCVVLSCAFLSWYTLQILSTVSAMKASLAPHLHISDTFNIRVGAFLGIITALLSVGGIRLIKWFNLLALPLLFSFVLYSLISNESFLSHNGSWAVQIPAVLATCAMALDTMINLPTFFRHRRSEIDAFFALSIFIFFTSVLECLSVFLVNAETGQFAFQFLSNNTINVTLVILFLVITLICVNLSNIYFAGAALEEVFPWSNKSKELAILGLVGTSAFTLFQAKEIIYYIESLLTSFIGILGVTILLGYLARVIVVHRVRMREIGINMTCWVVGCFVSVAVIKVELVSSGRDKSFFAGIGSSILVFLIILFVEETIWSGKKSFRHQLKH